MIRIKSDYRALERDLRRLDEAPQKAAKYMDVIFYKGFGATQALVHVETGSLKSSGKATTEFDGDNWKGEITYGGPSLGINNPVTYAIYEKARGVDGHPKGDHDFFTPLHALDSQFTEAILKALS